VVLTGCPPWDVTNGFRAQDSRCQWITGGRMADLLAAWEVRTHSDNTRRSPVLAHAHHLLSLVLRASSPGGRIARGGPSGAGVPERGPSPSPHPRPDSLLSLVRRSAGSRAGSRTAAAWGRRAGVTSDAPLFERAEAEGRGVQGFRVHEPSELTRHNELELELIQPHMAQEPVLRGEVGCACVAREVSAQHTPPSQK